MFFLSPSLTPLTHPPVLVPAEALKAMEKVASHINEMQKIYEDYGSVFDQLVAEQIGHDKEVKTLLRLTGAVWAAAPQPQPLLPRPSTAHVPHFSTIPTWGAGFAYVVCAIFSAWPLGAEYISKLLEYLAGCIFKVNAKSCRLGSRQLTHLLPNHASSRLRCPRSKPSPARFSQGHRDLDGRVSHAFRGGLAQPSALAGTHPEGSRDDRVW